MATVSQYYAIAGQLPFHDVDVHQDNRLYLDPHAVRLSNAPQPFAADAARCADSFLERVTHSIQEGSPLSMAEGERLLQSFKEPWETRLGMAAEGFAGHGGAGQVGSWIWSVLSQELEAFVRVGLLRQLEDLPLFVSGVDRDITSDITTRIIFGPLGRFTEEMVARFPEFSTKPHSAATFRRQVWDAQERRWDYELFELPVVDGKPLVLVPLGWARRNLLMSAGRYFETSVLSYAQMEQAVINSHGKLVKSPKWSLKRQEGLDRGRSTNIAVTERAYAADEDLLQAFKDFVRRKHEI